jgi:hypothetical protein
VHPYRYAISLRFRHPNRDLSSLGGLLRLEPKRTWQSGEPRATPKGTPLKGAYPESYWYCELTEEPENSETCALEDMLARWTSRLSAHRSELEQLRAEGGRIEYFVWLYCDRNLGIELSPELLSDIAGLGISLGVVCDPPPLGA